MTSVKGLLISIALLFSFTTVFLLNATNAEALYRRRLRKPTSQIRSRGTGVTGIGVTPRLRADRLALIVNFSNLNRATSVTYLLTYKSNGKTEGSQGVLRSQDGSSASRTILFGTCSAGVCTYHTSLTNMRFRVTAKMKNGKTYIYPYRIRP